MSRWINKEEFIVIKWLMCFRYKENAVKIGKLIGDQPMTGLERAIWWIEYVIRNNGAPHLRNP